MFKFVFVVSILAFLGFTLFSPFIRDFLHLDNIFYILLVGFCVFIFYLQAFNASFLQGLMKFGFISIINSFGGIIKLAVGVILVILGLKAFSGIWAFAFMCSGIFLVSFIPLKSIFLRKMEKTVHIPTKEILNYALPAFVIVLFMTSFTSTDIILVKHFFNSHDAGFYAGLSLIGRVIFYFTAPIPSVMFPLLIRRHNLGKSFSRLFYLALLLVLIPSIAITGFYFLFPNFVINLFLGGRDYLTIVPYIGFFGIYLTIFSLLNVCVNFFLSLNKTKIASLVALAALSQIVLIYIFHSNFYQVIGISITVSSILLLTLLAYYAKLFLNLKVVE
jgi:O-antigen/teichoic acid export membrane protein